LKRNNSKALVFSSADWHQGVVGIGAARLADRYGLPSALIAVQENGIGKGSVRSAGVVNVRKVLERCSSLLLAFGGHKEAGGFSIQEEKIMDFTDMFNAAVEELVGDDILTGIHDVDMEISVEECDMELLSFLELMEPFGQGNIEPVFMLRGVDVQDECRIVGNGHLKFNGRQNSGEAVNFIGFSKGKIWKPHEIYGRKLDILANFGKNNYKGKLGKQFRILDLHLNEEDSNSMK
jgi:single-stranded-DNA-specific exonuclease